MSTPVIFTGSTPQNYHEGLGPMFFEPYARDTAARVTLERGGRLLEIAAGTGIVTRHLLTRLPEGGHLVATDLGEPMLDVARANIAADPRLEWQVADACALPFTDNEFDGVVCQFGLMFFPDKPGALREMHRVSKPGTTIHVSVWGSLDQTPIARIAHDTIGMFFPADPPPFYHVPFGLCDEAVVRAFFESAGFDRVSCDVVDTTGESATADLAARGLVCGSPAFAQITQRDPAKIPDILQAVSSRLSAEGGAAPMRLPMRARVFTATA
jgi:SAM-dependent methyltransferase